MKIRNNENERKKMKWNEKKVSVIERKWNNESVMSIMKMKNNNVKEIIISKWKIINQRK